MSEILFEKRGPIGLVTLNRPAQLNALNEAMAAAFRQQLAAWSVDADVKAVAVRGAGEKAFCAGGDIRGAGGAGPEYAPKLTAFFAEEYQLNRAIKRFGKPYIAFMDGVCMGGGAGLSIHGDYRIGGDRLMFAMPEMAIGLIPDVGASFFLPRLPRRLGLHLGLTGARLTAADGVNAHLIDYYIRSERFETVLEQLVAADFSDGADEAICEILALNASAPETPGLKEHLEEIDAAYGAESLEGCLAALEGGSDWGKAQAAIIRKGCPATVKMAWRLLREPAADIEAALIQEYRAACFCVSRPDFYEGVTATLVEKRAPVWSPATLEVVKDADIAGALQPPAGGDLSFEATAV